MIWKSLFISAFCAYRIIISVGWIILIQYWINTTPLKRNSKLKLQNGKSWMWKKRKPVFWIPTKIGIISTHGTIVRCSRKKNAVPSVFTKICFAPNTTSNTAITTGKRVRTKKIGKNNPKAAEIEADNTARQEMYLLWLFHMTDIKTAGRHFVWLTTI